MPPKHALALCKQKILRFWGLAARRGWARLILGRFHDLVLSTAIPRPPRASQTLLPINNKLSSMQTLGLAPLKPLALAGGVAATPNRPFLLSDSPFRFSNYPLLRGGGELKKKKHTHTQKHTTRS